MDIVCLMNPFMRSVNAAVDTAFRKFQHRLVDRLEIRPQILAENARFTAQLARNDRERDAIFKLRFDVFNLELNEGLEQSFSNRKDRDRFDDVCEHIFIREKTGGAIVGTYRMQLGTVARQNFGYYSAQEFDFGPFLGLESRMVELGRACILREFRSYDVLSLLWRAVGAYAVDQGARYLIGCSSVSTQDPSEGWSLYRRLLTYEVAPQFRTIPTKPYTLTQSSQTTDVRIPRLLRAYLAIGAKICGPPALDREFKTVDFLTLLDIESMSSIARTRFFSN